MSPRSLDNAFAIESDPHWGQNELSKQLSSHSTNKNTEGRKMSQERARRPTVVLISAIVALVSICLVAAVAFVGPTDSLSGGNALLGALYQIASTVGGIALVVFIVSGIAALIRRGREAG
jgi:Mn2+/Fe2+ NRAMP family transporter